MVLFFKFRQNLFSFFQKRCAFPVVATSINKYNSSRTLEIDWLLVLLLYLSIWIEHTLAASRKTTHVIMWVQMSYLIFFFLQPTRPCIYIKNNCHLENMFVCVYIYISVRPSCMKILEWNELEVRSLFSHWGEVYMPLCRMPASSV